MTVFQTDKVIGWAKGLFVSLISGTSSALLAVIGSRVIGTDIPFDTIYTIAASAAIFNLLTYLAKSPLPE